MQAGMRDPQRRPPALFVFFASALLQGGCATPGQVGSAPRRLPLGTASAVAASECMQACRSELAPTPSSLSVTCNAHESRSRSRSHAQATRRQSNVLFIVVDNMRCRASAGRPRPFHPTQLPGPLFRTFRHACRHPFADLRSARTGTRMCSHRTSMARLALALARNEAAAQACTIVRVHVACHRSRMRRPAEPTGSQDVVRSVLANV